MRLAVAFALSCLAVVVTARTRASEGTAGAEDFPPVGAVPVVRLSDPGNEPRSPLRYRWTAGERYQLQAKTEMSFTMGPAAAEATPRRLPDFVVTGGLEILSVDSTGVATVAVSLRISAGEVEGVDPEFVREIDARYGAIGELPAKLTIDPRGRCVVLEMRQPEGLGEQAAEMVTGQPHQLPVMFAAYVPEEPVGEGARWERLRTVPHSDFVAPERVLLELKKRQGSDVVIEQKSVLVEPAREKERGGRRVRVIEGRRISAGVGVGRLDSLKLAVGTSATRRVREQTLPEGKATERAIQMTTRFVVTPEPPATP